MKLARTNSIDYLDHVGFCLDQFELIEKLGMIFCFCIPEECQDNYVFIFSDVNDANLVRRAWAKLSKEQKRKFKVFQNKKLRIEIEMTEEEYPVGWVVALN